MEQKNIDRINELAKKKKTEGLSEEEHAEHKSLREEYLLAIRKNLTGTLDNTYIQLPNGERVKLQKKDK